jgi:Zn-finger nucleic acid-binding protein
MERSQGYVPAQGYAPPPQEYRSSDSGYRNEPHREGYRDDHRRDDRHYDSHGHGHHKKKKGFLGEIFDIFD